VVRGGSWYGDPGNALVADRVRYESGYRDFVSGFRLARTL